MLFDNLNTFTTTIRIIIALAAINNMKLHHIDVNTKIQFDSAHVFGTDRRCVRRGKRCRFPTNLIVLPIFLSLSDIEVLELWLVRLV
jgi:hypothetical protein